MFRGFALIVFLLWSRSFLVVRGKGRCGMCPSQHTDKCRFSSVIDKDGCCYICGKEGQVLLSRHLTRGHLHSSATFLNMSTLKKGRVDISLLII
ncbi:uncharacterized protein LOC143036793 isoform X3 [Oratosquilla oratoria]|uniref:uncharacterized protein LOC143036793 isoform X3 n=1 Tax=Oratosquilla oratoria TaxID=337810 RepID=UPI003F76D093